MKTRQRFFRRMTASVLFGAMLLLFTACPSSKPTYVDFGRIPQQYLATVPYKNGDVFRMQHETSKLIIDFEVSRHRSKDMGEGYGQVPERFQPALDYYYEYEVDLTTCKPRYPIFNVNIIFSNEYMRFDEEQGYDPINEKMAQIYGMGNAMIPFIGEDHSGYEVLDSLEINGRYYYDVFKLKADYSYYEEEEMIYVRTYFYNYENGLLGILMSNGEKYWLYED